MVIFGIIEYRRIAQSIGIFPEATEILNKRTNEVCSSESVKLI